MFRTLPPADFGPTDADSLSALAVLAAKMTADPDPAKDGPDAEESGIPALYTYLGVLGGAAADAGPVKWMFFAIGLVATVAVAVLIARKAREKLQEAGVDDAAAG